MIGSMSLGDSAQLRKTCQKYKCQLLRAWLAELPRGGEPSDNPKRQGTIAAEQPRGRKAPPEPLEPSGEGAVNMSEALGQGSLKHVNIGLWWFPCILV